MVEEQCSKLHGAGAACKKLGEHHMVLIAKYRCRRGVRTLHIRVRRWSRNRGSRAPSDCDWKIEVRGTSHGLNVSWQILVILSLEFVFYEQYSLSTNTCFRFEHRLIIAAW